MVALFLCLLLLRSPPLFLPAGVYNCAPKNWPRPSSFCRNDHCAELPLEAEPWRCTEHTSLGTNSCPPRQGRDRPSAGKLSAGFCSAVTDTPHVQHEWRMNCALRIPHLSRKSKMSLLLCSCHVWIWEGYLPVRLTKESNGKGEWCLPLTAPSPRPRPTQTSWYSCSEGPTG